jgi:hypothetical protein
VDENRRESHLHRGARQRKNACLRSSKDPNANRRMGRSSGFRIGLLTAPSRPACSRLWSRPLQDSGICGFRPRLQRRDRDGFAPSSLFFAPGHKPETTPMSAVIVTRAGRMSTDQIGRRAASFQPELCARWDARRNLSLIARPSPTSGTSRAMIRSRPRASRRRMAANRFAAASARSSAAESVSTAA